MLDDPGRFISTIPAGSRRRFRQVYLDDPGRFVYFRSMETYRPRIVDELLRAYLEASPAVFLAGARATGKTTTALQASSSWVQLDREGPDIADVAAINPSAILEGETPRLLDEWQLAPNLWGAVRRAVDENPHPGRFILSGSAWPDSSTIKHPGAGRILTLVMRPMTLFETGDSAGSFSLSRLFAGEDPVDGSELSPHSVGDIARLITRGGWPSWVDRDSSVAELMMGGYLDNLAENEFPFIGGPRRSPQRFLHFVRAYASLTAHPAPLTTVQERLGEDGYKVGEKFASMFHEFASRMYLIEDQPPWAPARRSKSRLVATPKRHLVDPSLAASAMGASHDAVVLDPRTLGFLFESLVLRDVRVYSQPLRGTAFHYRSKDGTAEIDIVIELRDGRWVGIEVKLSPKSAIEAAPRLKQVAESIKRPPEGLLLVTPTGATAQVDDRTWVVPIGLLGP
ncbi:ATP-binding protein [Corynebacterium aquatimens]